MSILLLHQSKFPSPGVWLGMPDVWENQLCGARRSDLGTRASLLEVSSCHHRGSPGSAQVGSGGHRASSQVTVRSADSRHKDLSPRLRQAQCTGLSTATGYSPHPRAGHHLVPAPNHASWWVGRTERMTCPTPAHRKWLVNTAYQRRPAETEGLSPGHEVMAKNRPQPGTHRKPCVRLLRDSVCRTDATR